MHLDLHSIAKSFNKELLFSTTLDTVHNHNWHVIVLKLRLVHCQAIFKDNVGYQ